MSKNRGNSQRIQHRRGSAAEWTVNNPILFAGELGYETDTTRIKVGDGVTQWVNLAYVGQFGASNLDGLSDVSITSPASGAVLRYDGASWTDYVLSKSDVGLSNVDNTSDTNKPVSAAQATADAAVASAASSDATSKANAAQAAAIQRANHTGTQTASTITGLAAVATSGSYNDLSSKPTIPSAYTLPTASSSTLGGVRIGSGISIDGSGIISASSGYTLPAATTTTLGGVIVGTGLGVSSGTVAVTYGTTSGTACQGNDARLSDARVPTSHTHGNITNAGAIGSTSGQIVVTTTSGVLTTAATISSASVSGLGTIATQNASSVAITGGSIDGTAIGATTASTGAFTTVTTTGNVGIGTTSPQAPLDVAGNAYFNSSLVGGVNHVTIRGNSPVSGWGVLSFTTRVGTSDVNIASIAGVIETNTSGSESGGFIFYTKASTGSLAEKVRITSSGNVGIGTASPTISSGVGLHLSGSTLRLGTARTPASSTATGNQGEVCWDSSYLYVCIATNTWRRIALTTW